MKAIVVGAGISLWANAIHALEKPRRADTLLRGTKGAFKLEEPGKRVPRQARRVSYEASGFSRTLTA
jgi:hypothetical protein